MPMSWKKPPRGATNFEGPLTTVRGLFVPGLVSRAALGPER